MYLHIIGTTPDHIRALRENLKHLPPRPLIKSYEGSFDPNLYLAGLEPSISKAKDLFLNIGERCNVAGSRRFLRLVKENKYVEALEVAKAQVENGAQVIDINMDEGMLDAKKCMAHFLNLIASEPEIAKAPVCIDSSKFE